MTEGRKRRIFEVGKRRGSTASIEALNASCKREWLATPTSWVTAFKLGRVSPPIETLFALPAAVHRAGVELTGLRIRRLRLPRDFPLWLAPDGEEDRSWNPDHPPAREGGELGAACDSLRVFEFTPGYEPNSCPSVGQGWLTLWTNWTGLREVLNPILASKSLQHIRIDLLRTDRGMPYGLAMPRPPAWAHIQILHLQDGCLEATAFASFLSATTGTLTRLHLDGMYRESRFDRPWSTVTPPYSRSLVLDLLHAHYRRARGKHSGGGDYTRLIQTAAAQEPLIVRLRRPGGAEFVDRSLSETDMAHIKALFGPDDDEGGGLSAVERFILGLSDRNPLVEAGKTPLLYP